MQLNLLNLALAFIKNGFHASADPVEASEPEFERTDEGSGCYRWSHHVT